MKKKSLLLLSGLLLISLGLESCKETPRTTVTQPNQTDSGKPSTPSDKPDKPDTGGQPTNPTTASKDRDFVDGPATTEVPKDTTPIDPDDPIYDDEIVPVWAQDESQILVTTISTIHVLILKLKEQCSGFGVELVLVD